MISKYLNQIDRPFKLNIVIIEGDIPTIRGFSSLAYVETSLDKQIIDITPSISSPFKWERHISKELERLDELNPITLSFSVFKKVWTSYSYKHVGTTDITLKEFYSSLNQGPILREININTGRKSIGAMTNIKVSIELKENDSKILNLGEKIKAKSEGLFFDLINLVINSKAELIKAKSFQSWFKNAFYKFDNHNLGVLIKFIVIFLLFIFFFSNIRQWVSIRSKLSQFDHSYSIIEKAFQKASKRHHNLLSNMVSLLPQETDPYCN